MHNKQIVDLMFLYILIFNVIVNMIVRKSMLLFSYKLFFKITGLVTVLVVSLILSSVHWLLPIVRANNSTVTPNSEPFSRAAVHVSRKIQRNTLQVSQSVGQEQTTHGRVNQELQLTMKALYLFASRSLHHFVTVQFPIALVLFPFPSFVMPPINKELSTEPQNVAPPGRVTTL